jgi:hypothetical protein
MRFWEHVPNSLRNKNMGGSFLSTLKNGFFGLQNSIVPLKHSEKNFFFNFEHYDLANGEE